MSTKPNTQQTAESLLRDSIQKDPSNWEDRKKLAHLLYNQGKTKDAANLIWDTPHIPAIDLELGFAIKILGKGAPRKAIRLLTSLQENNKGKAVQNLGLANAFMHYGMVMQAARFYGAALAEDPSLASPDLEHFLLWTDDKEKIWGDFKQAKPKLDELPWMKRDKKEAENLKKAMKGHTTPIKIPGLQEVTAEKVVHEMYVQSHQLGTDPTPPPSVTIPIDQVNPKDILVDPERGAAPPITPEQAKETAAHVGGSTGLPLPMTNPNAPVAPTTTTPAVAQAAPTTKAAAIIPKATPIPTQPLAQAEPLKPKSASDTTAPLLKPTITQPLAGGKISINKPKADS